MPNRGLRAAPHLPPLAPALVKIKEFLLKEPTTSVLFDLLPPTFRALMLLGNGRMNTSNADNYRVMLRFNGDAGANYDYSSLGEVFGQTQMQVGVMPLASDLADLATSFELKIPNYANTRWQKSLVGNATNQYGTSAGNTQIGTSYGRWQSKSPITSISLFPGGSSGQFAADTVFMLYGLN